MFLGYESFSGLRQVHERGSRRLRGVPEDQAGTPRSDREVVRLFRSAEVCSFGDNTKRNRLTRFLRPPDFRRFGLAVWYTKQHIELVVAKPIGRVEPNGIPMFGWLARVAIGMFLCRFCREIP